MAKRLCVDGEAEEDSRRQVAAGEPHRSQTDNNPAPVAPGLDVNRNVASSPGIPGGNPKPEPSPAEDCELRLLRKEVKEKMETLRRLKMVKMYRSKVMWQ